MLQEQKFWLLVSLKLSGEASPQELGELNTLIEQNPYFLECLEVLQGLWSQKSGGLVERKEQAFDRHLQRLDNYLSAPMPVNEPEEKALVAPAKARVGYRRLWWGGGLAAAILGCWLFLNATWNQA